MQILDDESYFDLNGHDFFGGQRYSFSGSPDNVSDAIRYRFKEKFGKKLMIWAAISQHGVSDIYFHESKGAVNSEIYIEECIKKRLTPFIMEHDKRIIFLPNLASSHYSQRTITTLNELSIPFVPKSSNPPAVPELRPIEIFWGHMKAKVYADGFVAQNSQELINRIKKVIKKFPESYYRGLIGNLKIKVDLACKQRLQYIRKKL